MDDAGRVSSSHTKSPSAVRVYICTGDVIPGCKEIADLALDEQRSSGRKRRSAAGNALLDDGSHTPASQTQQSSAQLLHPDNDDAEREVAPDRPLDYFIGVSERVKDADNPLLDEEQNVDENRVNYLQSEAADRDLKSLNRQLFAHMFFMLHEKFNLILYGFGSKRNFLNNFCATFLRDEHYLMINGYFPALTVRDVSSNLKDALEAENSDTESILQAVDQLDDTFYLVVHSIDMLFSTNNAKIKSLVTNVVVRSQGSIRLIATVDHVNSGLLFDTSEKAKMDLMWIHVPTLNPYTIERGYTGSGSASTGDSDLNLSAVLRVYESLTPNAQKIFLSVLDFYVQKKKQLREEKHMRKEAAKLAKQQKKDRKRGGKRKSRRRKDNDDSEDQESDREDHNAGARDSDESNENGGEDQKSGRNVESSESLPFSVLYRMCREQYLVNSEVTLKAQLIEFQDHHIMKVRKASDGTPVLQILISMELVQTFLCKIRDV